ncbi:MAG TPA: hypothetical protein PKM94_06000, partial [candidate division Zixibacteria bacterium]|nr:hypothetical protein [candidate division Zixibacteria bacterium]
MEKLSYEFEYLLAAAGTGLAQRLSPAAADRFAVTLGDTVHAVWTTRREIARENLRQALGPRMAEPLIRATVKRVFENMARSFIEVSRFERLGPDGARAIIVGDGLAHIEQARAKGRGCVFITAHYGNWELLGNWPALMGHPTVLLVGVQHNPKIHALFNRFRQTLGITTIETGVAARGVLRALRENKVVGIAG